MRDSYIGSPSGDGNPPGKYSPSNLNQGGRGTDGHFVNDSSYRGDMHVGMSNTANVVGNQPKTNSESTLESKANKEDPIPMA